MSFIIHAEHVTILLMAKRVMRPPLELTPNPVDMVFGGPRVELTVHDSLDPRDPMYFEYATREWRVCVGGKEDRIVFGDVSAFERDLIYIKLALS